MKSVEVIENGHVAKERMWRDSNRIWQSRGSVPFDNVFVKSSLGVFAGWRGLFAAVIPGEAESDEGADGDGAEDEDDGAGDGDPGDDDEAGGDDGAGFGAGDGEVAEGEFLRLGLLAAAYVFEHFETPGR